MGFIYVIKNDVNDKIYIGQTSRSIEVRWKEHVRQHNCIIYKAINKYGIEHFWIEQIEECDDALLNEREKYWIQQYKAFESGYNQTIGGQDSTIMTQKVDEVLQLWNQGLTINRIVLETGLNVETVRGYLNKNGIDHDQIQKRANVFIGAAKARPIEQYTENNEFIRLWPSTAEAIRNGYIRSSIQRSLKDGRPHGGYIWKGV